RDVPIGDLWLVASCEPYAQSRPVQVTVPAETSTSVQLELQPGLTGIGRVMNGISSAAIDAAQLQLFVSNKGIKLDTARRSVMTDPRGQFQMDGLQQGSNILEVSADGYQTLEVERQIGSSPLVDLGTISLYPTQTVVARLHAQNRQHFEQYSAVLITG